MPWRLAAHQVDATNAILATGLRVLFAAESLYASLPWLPECHLMVYATPKTKT
jgi:hypothetical protein